MIEVNDAIFTDVYTSVRKQLTARTVEKEKQFPSPYDDASFGDAKVIY